MNYLKSEYFECQCNCNEHTLKLWLDSEPIDPKDPWNGIIYVSVFLASDVWYKRLWYGLKYIFGYKSKFGAFDEILLREEDYDILRSMLDKSEKLYKVSRDYDVSHQN